MRPTLLLLALPLPLFADPAADLVVARSAHTKELTRLREKLLDDIDAVIKKESAAGAGIDYLLKEKRGFQDGGTLPVLPKLLFAGKAYQDAKAKADGKLADALERAGRKEEAAKLRDESKPRPERPAVKDVQTAADLLRFLEDSVWDWGDGEMKLKWGGSVEHAGWTKAGLVTRWAAIDRRTAVLLIEKGRDTNKVCVLMFDEGIVKFGGVGFDGKPMTEPKLRKR